jgi:hypothetical protein
LRLIQMDGSFRETPTDLSGASMLIEGRIGGEPRHFDCGQRVVGGLGDRRKAASVIILSVVEFAAPQGRRRAPVRHPNAIGTATRERREMFGPRSLSDVAMQKTVSLRSEP